MRRDPKQFRERFQRWKNGEQVYDAGLPDDQGSIDDVVITPDKEYNAFLNTLPMNQRMTPESEYTTNRYWKLNGKPKNFKEAKRKNMYSLQDDYDDNGKFIGRSWHGNSIMITPSGDYEWMKPKSHRTAYKELEFYNSKDGSEFRHQYELIDDPDRPGFYKYRRRVLLPKYKYGKNDLYKGRDLQEIVITPLNQSVPELESPLPTLEEYMGEFMQQQYGILTPYQWQKNFREQRLKMAIPKYETGKDDEIVSTAVGKVSKDVAEIPTINSKHVEHTLPELEVVGYHPIKLHTYYPITSQYPFTGHSELEVPLNDPKPGKNTWYRDYFGYYVDDPHFRPIGIVDKTMSSDTYNFVTNNCANATLDALNTMFGTHEKPNLFTTPGDVQDYAIRQLGGRLIENKNGRKTIAIPRNKDNYKQLSERFLNWYSKQNDKETVFLSDEFK